MFQPQPTTADPSECPGTEDASHLLALIVYDHCPACGTSRVPTLPGPPRLPADVRALMIVAGGAVGICAAVVLGGGWLAGHALGAW